MREFIKKLPKAELHVHLFGTLTSELYKRVANRNGLPVTPMLESEFVFTDLPDFICAYDTGASVFHTELDFFDITYDYLKRSATDNVKYVEFIIDPQTHEQYGINIDTMMKGITSAIEMAQIELGVQCRLILGFVRHLGSWSALNTLHNSLKYLNHFVGVGLGGIEEGHPPSDFMNVFKEARKYGLKLSAHCGETTDSDNIKDGLLYLNLARVDHGYSLIDDENLMDYIYMNNISVTVCPISNVKLGICGELSDHPLIEYLHRGLKININSDDPAYFGASLLDNLVAVQEAFNLNEFEIYKLLRNAFSSIFDEELKQRYLILLAQEYIKLTGNDIVYEANK